MYTLVSIKLLKMNFINEYIKRTWTDKFVKYSQRKTRVSKVQEDKRN